MTTEDPERLLAEALRAQAGRGHADAAPRNIAGNTSRASGDRFSDQATATVPVRWILLLAALLGLA
ncbi:MAG: hypothetical protein ACRDQW_00515, partial [Haloechinothrix sp.]